PRTVVPALVACVDRPTSSVPDQALRVVAPHVADAHDASTRNHLVVLNAGTLQGLLVGQQYFTRRLKPPVTGEPVAAATPGSIRTTGWLTVVAANEGTALARVDYACTGIESGDYLEPYTQPVLPTAVAAAGKTNFADLGRVLFGVDRRESFGAGDFLSIDRGRAQGMVSGARVAFYRDRGNGTPLVELGAGIVIEPSTETSKVVVERSSEEIRRGDYVGLRGVP
ncbi:MAG: hypothetical protein ACRD1H_14900, partial [Vicinamibacterales bacterium]